MTRSYQDALSDRIPEVDHRLVEHVMPLEKSAKLDWRRSKIILKDIMEGSLPKRILTRPKMGFNAPTTSIGELRVDESGASGLFNTDFRLQPAKDDVTFKSFSFAVLNEWLRRFISYKQGSAWGET